MPIALSSMTEAQVTEELTECRRREQKLDALIRESNKELDQVIARRWQLHKRLAELQAERWSAPNGAGPCPKQDSDRAAGTVV